MLWPSFIDSFYFVIFCLRTIFHFFWSSLAAILGFLLVIFAPVTHLASYVTHALLVPFYFLSKFETLYIYLGVAALIGLFTGSLLHFSSSILTKALNLQATPERPSRTAASVRAAREKKRLEDVWQASKPTGSGQARTQAEDTSKNYSEFIETDRAKRKEGQGLLSQTILEEEDDSEDGF